MSHKQALSSLPTNSFAKMSTVVGTVELILGLSLAGHSVMLMTKYPAFFSHSMTSHSFTDVTGDLGHGNATVPGTAVVVVVVANDVRTVSEGISSLSFSR